MTAYASSSGVRGEQVPALIQIVGAGDFAAGLYTLIDAAGASLIDLTVDQFLLDTSPGGYYEVLHNGDLFQLQVGTIPEPSTIFLLIGGLVAAVLFARRKKVTSSA